MAKTTVNPIEAKLETARAIQDAEAWKPAIGEHRTGELVAIKRGVTQNGPAKGKAYPLAIFRDTDTSEFYAFHAFHGVPKSRLIEANPLVGDIITIKYDGDAPLPEDAAPDAKPMKMMTVLVHDKPSANVAWDSFA